MSEEKLHVITPATRLENLALSWISLSDCYVQFDLHWWIVIDLVPQPFPESVRNILAEYGNRITIWFHHAPTPGAWGHPQRSAAIDFISDGWVWTLDDDNLCHPQFAERLHELMAEHPDKQAFVVAQDRADGRTLIPTAETLRPEGVDTAQYIIRRDLIGDERIKPIPADDGGFVQRIYESNPSAFVFIEDVLCYHNRLAR
jgi:hypothetical protein